MYTTAECNCKQTKGEQEKSWCQPSLFMRCDLKEGGREGIVTCRPTEGEGSPQWQAKGHKAPSVQPPNHSMSDGDGVLAPQSPRFPNPLKNTRKYLCHAQVSQVPICVC